MRYDDYTVEDFILDEDFRNWVLYPDQASRMFWLQWIEDHPHKVRLVEEAKSIILSAEDDEINIDESKNLESWEKIQSKIAESEMPYKKHNGKSRIMVSVHKPVFYRAAAVFVGLLLLSTGYFYYATSADTYYATTFGEIKTVLLPDSSQVTLNANSTLRVPNPWLAENTREVSLEGEAFFVVKKKPHGSHKTFVVYANDIKVEVLGTRFNVNNRRGTTWVVLNSGKVALKTNESASRSLIMNPGEFAQFSEEAGEFTVRRVDTEMYTGWRNNRLIFDGNTIAEIVSLLEDNYGFDVTLKELSLFNRRFKGTFPADRPDILLSALSESFNVKITQAGNKIVIENKE